MTVGTNPYATSLLKNATIQQWVQSYIVYPTNNGSNYWTISLYRLDTLASISSFNTSAAGAGVYTRRDSGALSISITTGMLALFVRVDPVGSPGPIDLYGPAVLVQ